MPLNLAPGVPPEDPGSPPPMPPEAPEMDAAATNPSLALTHEEAERFGLGACQPGQDYTATVTLRHADAAGGGEMGGEAGPTLEIISMSDVQPAAGGGPEAEAEAGEEPDPEAKMLGYNRPKRSGGPAPVDMNQFKGGRRV